MFNQQNQQQAKEPFHDLKVANSWLTLIARCGAVTVEVLLHTGLGSRYVGLKGLGGALLILVWGMFFPHRDLSALMVYLGLFLVCCFAARLDSLRRTLKGGQCHSRYTGTPQIMKLLPWMEETTIKRIVEPILLIFVGVLIGNCDLPLGGYLIFAGFCLMCSSGLDNVRERVRAQDMYDTVVDQQMTAGRFRQMYRG